MNETLNRATVGNHLDLRMVHKKTTQIHRDREREKKRERGIADEEKKKQQNKATKPDPTSSHSFSTTRPLI